MITATGYDRLGEATNLPQDRHDNTYEWSDSLSWTTGRHTMKFGAEVRHFQENFLFDSSARGTINFTPFYTAQVSTTAAGVVNAVTGTGNAIADLLLGFPNTASVSRSFAGINANTVAGLRQTSTNLFVQDDFRILPNLTLNLGLRWEYNSPTLDKYNHLATFDPNFPNSTPLPYLRISTSDTPNIYNSSKKEFAPRFGFAYTPFGPKTVIRGGYGFFWDIKLLNVILNSNLTAPFLTGYSFNQSTNGAPNINLANPYGGTGTPAIPSASWVENPFRDGYVQQWSFNIQRELTSSMGLTVGYVGSKGTHLDRAYDYNEPAPTASFTQSLRKYPAYASISVRSPGASSIYHSLQLSVEKRFSKGLSFLSAYTFSKSIDDGSLWNGSAVAVTNFHLERGLSTFDTRHRWITSYTYDLPYGHGRMFGGTSAGGDERDSGRVADQRNSDDSIGQSAGPLDGPATFGHTDGHAAGRDVQSERLFARPRTVVQHLVLQHELHRAVWQRGAGYHSGTADAQLRCRHAEAVRAGQGYTLSAIPCGVFQ